MNITTILAILRVVLPVATQIVAMFHGSAVAKEAAQNAVDKAG